MSLEAHSATRQYIRVEALPNERTCFQGNHDKVKEGDIIEEARLLGPPGKEAVERGSKKGASPS